uniref:Uncharacterized protein LOC101242461 n=1 Tax=Phallusia mammillata TaxID=59560 RepID=A0A6F9DIR0_9ASCI|nr:uncharacterized protein LOC101242461 [Phallusia mammillata]
MQQLYSRALAILMHVLIITMQVLAMPIGIQIGKIFWCVPSSNSMDVANTVVCWQGEHIAYILIGLLVAIAVFILYPIWLIRSIRFEVISSNARKHEGYLQLKHCEYVFDLDTSWIDRQFLSFGSFRRFWIYHKPINHIFKLIVLCFYAGLFNDRLVQASLIFASLLIMLVMCMIRIPFRVTSFNIPLLWSWLCLCCNSVIGAMQNIPEIQSAFLLPSYIEGELILINVSWLVGMALFVVYFVLRLKGIICANVPLWPSMLHHGMDGLNKNTRRYMVAAINGKSAVKQALNCPALLAPVHLLAHHIQVVNALACESEYIDDPLHSTLRDALDDLIDLHSKLVPQSIFTESLKMNVQSTVTDLMEVLPAFTKRLRQRQFDMILVPPVRRRLLLKMFAISCFMRGRQQQPAHEPGVRKLWTAPDSRHLIYDEGFHEDTEEESIIDVDNIEIIEADERMTVSHHSFGTFNFPAEVPGPSTTDV